LILAKDYFREFVVIILKSCFMKTFFVFTVCMTSLHLKAQPGDSTVAKLVASNFQVISNFLNKKENSLQKISETVSFFTELTGIASEADGTYYGQYHPTAKDLDAWIKWFVLNKDYLFWDKELKSIILYKKVKPTIL
jgi:hypothetical protein